MPNIILTGFTGEGETDRRFLLPVIRRTLRSLLLESPQEIEVYEPNWLGMGKGIGIVERVQQAHLNGLTIFVVHADADAADGDQALNERIKPAISTVRKLGIDNLPIVPLIPVQETEAWLLADRETLKKALKTKLNDQELDLHALRAVSA